MIIILQRVCPFIWWFFDKTGSSMHNIRAVFAANVKIFLLNLIIWANELIIAFLFLIRVYGDYWYTPDSLWQLLSFFWAHLIGFFKVGVIFTELFYHICLHLISYTPLTKNYYNSRSHGGNPPQVHVVLTKVFFEKSGFGWLFPDWGGRRFREEVVVEGERILIKLQK